jgi:hypothetical protein
VSVTNGLVLHKVGRGEKMKLEEGDTRSWRALKAITGHWDLTCGRCFLVEF